MSERDLKLQVVFSMIEKITAPLRSIQKESGAGGKALKALRDRLKELDTQQKNVSGFRQLHNGLRETAGRLEAARLRVKTLAEQMQATENPTRTMTREFDRATKAAKLIKQQHERESQQLQVLRDKLSAAGISTQQLGQHERSLRNNIAETNKQITTQQQKLGELAKKHEQFAAAKSRMEKAQSRAGGMAMRGMGMTMAGGAMGTPVIKSIGEAAEFQQQVSRLRALGIGDSMVEEGVKFAKGMDVMGSSTLENLKLLTEAHSILRDFHHAQEVTPLLARMKFGIEGVMQQRGHGEGHGENAEKMFMDLIKVAELRGALTDTDTFKRVLDFSTKAYVASGGLVKPEDLLNMIKTGGVAAKQLSDNSFFFGMLHYIQEVGGDRAGTSLKGAYQNWVAGRGTNKSMQELAAAGLLNKGDIEYDTTGRILQVKGKGLRDVEKYTNDPYQYMIDEVLPRVIKPGMTDNQVMRQIGIMFSNTKGGDFMATMYMERANVLKHRIAAQRAYGIDPLNKEAGDIFNGKYLDYLAKRNNLELAFGEQILPSVNSGLDMLTSTLKSVGNFMQEHTTTAKVLALSFAGLSILLVVFGMLTIALASVIGPFALVRYGLTLLGIQGVTVFGVLRRIGAGFLRLGSLTMRTGSLLMAGGQYVLRFGGLLLKAGGFLLRFGMMALASPVGLIIAAIALLAAGAYLLYKNWEPVKAFFGNLWEQLRSLFSGGVAWLGGLVGRFADFGSNIVQGLANGISNGVGAVRDAIGTLGDNVVNWFKDKLGIHSPSLVFTELGQFTMQGLSNGIANNAYQPLEQIGSMTRRMAQIGGGLVLSAAITPSMAAASGVEPFRFDSRPPISANNMQSRADTAPAPIQIIINAAPGMDAQSIAQAVAAEIDKRERTRRRAQGSTLHDYD